MNLIKQGQRAVKYFVFIQQLGFPFFPHPGQGEFFNWQNYTRQCTLNQKINLQGQVAVA
jgi:hypothetical protein